MFVILTKSGKQLSLISVTKDKIPITFLSEKGRLIKDPVMIAITMNVYFVSIMSTVGLKRFQFDHACNLFEDHAGVIAIKSNLNNAADKFDFKKVNVKEVKRVVLNLNSKQATCHSTIPAKILKEFWDSYLPIITKTINESIKNLDYMNKKNCRLVSLLSRKSILLERILYNQLNDYIKNKHESRSNFYGSFKGL